MSRGGLILAVLAVALAAAAPARADEMFGVNVNRVFNDDFTPAHWDAPLAAVRASGVTVARSDAFWMWAEPDPPANGDHDYTWDMLDAEARALAEHGLRWQPILDYSALWAASYPGDYHSPPVSNDDYAAYARAFARRYGRGGAFWAENPDLPPLPVTTYEIWNEPNGAWFWRPAPDPGRYGDMYLRARGAIREADDRATVLVGGLVPDMAYVAAMYAARPLLHGNVDGVAYHPYAPTAAGVIANVRRLRLTLAGLGEGGVPIHLTELGWPTGGRGSPIVLPESRRAPALEMAADTLARSDCGVASVIAYTWVTPGSDASDVEDWYGIRGPGGAATPSSDAFERVVARWRSRPVRIRGQLCRAPDSDGDGLLDRDDPDDDGDGAPDTADKFRLDRHEWVDRDGDGSGDNADEDDDGDGRADREDAFPGDRREWSDLDADGLGDNADADDDGDGLLDIRERLVLRTSPSDLDTDDDGIGDGAERRTDPARADSDGDRLPDGLERGVTAPLPNPPGPLGSTNPRRFRPDRDPLTKTKATRADTDRDGLADGREDRNRDGLRGRRETDPLARDSDADGVRDGLDGRPLRASRR